MPSTILSPASLSRPAAALLTALVATAALAVAGPSHAQDVSGVSVTGQAPTSVTIRIAGLDTPAVRRQVSVAAKLVCRNAVLNRELFAFDLAWCADATREKTMSHYRAAIQRLDHADARRAAAPTLLVATIGK